jgi:ParB family chromosome partitioning protein
MHRSLNKLPQDVRDDCRGDRTISKTALVVIAKKKQARSMTSAYIAYKAKLQKGITKRGTDFKSVPRDPNEPQGVIDMMDKAAARVRSIETSAWSDESKIDFQESLTSLKTEIDNYLNPAPRLA